MTAGANFEIVNNRVQFWKTLVTGDKLITQDHEARFGQRQGSYNPEQQYGNPYVNTLSDDSISETERDLLLVSQTKECSLQDDRIIDAVVDTTSIVRKGTEISFKYKLFKTSGGSIQRDFSSDNN
jgi:hypothetical protein